MRNIEWGEYNQTVTHPLTLLLLAVACLWVLMAERDYVLVAFVVMACLVTSRHRLVISGIDLPYLRILFFFAIARLALRNDIGSIRLNSIDVLVFLYVSSSTIAYTALWGTTSAFINRLGFSIDTAGVYFLVRAYARSPRSVTRLLYALFVSTIFVSAMIGVEFTTGRNPFGALGGVREVVNIREGNIRVTGPFSHPIMVGTFGATLLTLSLGLRRFVSGLPPLLPVLAAVASAFVVVASGSSGPVLTVLAGMFALWAWRVQHQAGLLVLAAVAATLALHIVMEAPVWHLIARIDVVGGSTGYHRYLLIDRAIRRFPEWMLLGVRSTAHWGWGLQDITNMYILQGVRGGFVTFALFLGILWNAFRQIIRAYREVPTPDQKRLVWAFGATLFAHTVSFLGVSYFGQMVFFFFLLLGLVGGVAETRQVPEGRTITYRPILAKLSSR